MCKVAFFCQSKPIGSLPFSLPSPSSLLKLHSIQGMQNADIIHGDYGTWDAGCGIRGAGWGLRDWTNSWVGMTVLKNSNKGNPRMRFNIKKKCWKNIFPHRNNNSQNNTTAPVIPKPTILGRVCRDSSGYLLLFPSSLHFAPLDLHYRTGAQNRLN